MYKACPFKISKGITDSRLFMSAFASAHEYRRPYSFSASSTTPLTEASSAASKRRACTSTAGYSAFSSRLCVSRCSPLKSHRNTAFAPFWANWCAVARPIPSALLAPTQSFD